LNQYLLLLLLLLPNLLITCQGQALALGPQCTLLTADGRPLVGADGDFLFLGGDGKTLVDKGGQRSLFVVRF
jgi:hypothetical protein